MGIVTLVSGGLDSTLMSLMAHEEGSHYFLSLSITGNSE